MPAYVGLCAGAVALGRLKGRSCARLGGMAGWVRAGGTARMSVAWQELANEKRNVRTSKILITKKVGVLVCGGVRALPHA